jgi:hypothetical protein
MTDERNAESLFKRKLCEQGERTLIESRCERCGEILRGSAIFGDLRDQEQQHAAQCPAAIQSQTAQN